MPAKPPRGTPPVAAGPRNLIWLALGVSVAALVLSASGIVLTLNRGTASPTTAAVAPTDPADPFASDLPTDELASDDPGLPLDSLDPTPVTTPAAPDLEALIPKTVGSTTLTIESMRGTEGLGGDPGSRALIAAIGSLGKAVGDLEIADAYDESGASSLSVLAFKLPGVTSAKLEPIILQTWLSTNTPGVTKSTVTLGGVPVTKVSYGDAGANEYVVSKNDAVFVLETPDEPSVASFIAAMP